MAISIRLTIIIKTTLMEIENTEHIFRNEYGFTNPIKENILPKYACKDNGGIYV